MAVTAEQEEAVRAAVRKMPPLTQVEITDVVDLLAGWHFERERKRIDKTVREALAKRDTETQSSTTTKVTGFPVTAPEYHLSG